MNRDVIRVVLTSVLALSFAFGMFGLWLSRKEHGPDGRKTRLGLVSTMLLGVLVLIRIIHPPIADTSAGMAVFIALFLVVLWLHFEFRRIKS